ncbi:glutathione S-transferase family protein [Actibacterium sp. D379-3]
MIEIHHMPLTRSTRVIWALEELGIPYEKSAAQLPIQVNQPELLALHPAGTLPVVLDDGDVLIESLAICEILSRRHAGGKLLVEPGDPAHEEYLKWLWFGEASLAPQLGPAMRYGPFVPPEQQIPNVVADAIAAFGQRMPVLERALEDGREFLAGDRLTLADLSVAFVLFVSRIAGAGETMGPKASDYLAGIAARPAFLAAIADAPAFG